MEVDDIQQASKYSRVNSNAKINSSSIATGGQDESGGGTNNNCQAVVPTTTTTTNAAMVNGSGGGVGGEMVATGSSNRFGRQWQHSSRIIRVSRASGGKDRHSKVWTAKGPRDRRVRLSVNTAIEFYDLQDRLGYDQPSKAVEWLINAAADAINELPSLNTSNFPPETPRQLTDDRRVSTNMVEMDVDGLGQNQQQMGSKSGCSSNNSDNSKGSAGGLSLSQKEIRNKARERARERTAKEKERDGEPSRVNVVNGSQHLNQHQLNVSSMAPQTSSFTQLLTGRLSNLNENNNGGASSTPSPHGSGEVVGLFSKQSRDNNQWLSSASTTSSMADYFGAGLMSLSSSRVGQIQLGNNNHPQGPQVMTLTSFGGSENQHHHEHLQQQHHEQHFPFVSDHPHHLIQVANPTTSGASGNDYNLNFTMGSSTTATASLTASGFNNRGTLQSNSPSLVMPYLQRFSADGSGLPFFLGSAAPVSSASPTVDNHHHQQFQLPGLQLCYGDNGARQTDHKGKGKN